MRQNKIPQVQYRYYETPPDSHVLALLGEGWVREYGNDIDELHFHNCLEIGYCHNGSGVITFGNEKTPYSDGMLSIVPPNYLHTTNSVPGHKCRWEYLFIDAESFLREAYPDNVHFQEKLIERIYNNAVLLRYDENRELANSTLAIMDEYRQKNDMYLDSVRGLLLSLLICAARSCGANTADKSGSLRMDSILPAIDYVAKHYKGKVKISDMAEACHLSETHFRRIFLQSMHISPLDYVNLIRIEAACKLLRTTNDSVENIAVKCGFITITSLNRNFKEIMGTTPTGWRKDNQYYERKLCDHKVLPYEGWR